MKKIEDNEKLTDEMLEAYLDNIESETPDLWSRIETGFDKEVHKKKLHWQKYMGLAAAVLACVFFIRWIPTVMNTKDKEKSMNKEDIIYSDDFQEETDSMNEDVCMSDEAASDNAEESIMNNENDGGNDMEYEFDGIMNFGSLGLYYEAHLAGIDGECFSYNVYYEDELSDEKFEETKNAIDAYIMSNQEQGKYVGYIDVKNEGDKVFIYLDLGGIEPEEENNAIYGILTALNNVTGIKSVILNEGMDFYF